MAFKTQQDFFLEIARGNVSGMTHVNKIGRNSDVDTAAAEDIWSGGGVWVAPTTARTHNIASTSASDDGDPVGTGARTIRIYGLTGWGAAEVTEDITMDGTSNVATVNSYVIIHHMEVLTKGSSGPNVGTITATAQTDSTVTAQIAAGIGQTTMAIHGIPSTQTAYMTQMDASFLKSAGTAGGIDVSVKFNPEPNAQLTKFLTKRIVGKLSTGSSDGVPFTFRPYMKLPGPGIIKLTASSTVNNIDVFGGFDIIIVDN